MKRYIYTTLLVFATLFCQASGVPKDTICVKPGDTVRLIEYKNSIQEFLENKEKAIWSGCCEKMDVDIKEVQRLDGDEKSFLLEGWPAVIVNKNDAYITIEVTYERHLRCINIPENKEDAQTDASLAIWYFFGRLLSETKMPSVLTLSDTAALVTTHKVNLTYRFGVSFPENIPFKIKGDICFDDEEDKVELSVDSAYLTSDYNLTWIASGSLHSNDKGIFWKPKRLNDYLYPIVCTATACKGETRSDTVFIGNPTPLPRMEEINCIASSENSFVAKVKDADSRLLYHWIFKESGSNREQQYSEGDSVTFAISPNMPGVLRLISTGGCRASDTVSRKLHRSVMAGNIRLDGDTNCLFGGDSLSLVLQNAPQEHLVWRSKAGADTLLWNAGFVYRTNRTDTGVLAVSVFSKYCPEDTAVAAFNIRKDLAVSIEPNESCISAYTAQTFKAIGNGINPEVHWYGNGVELDTMGYPTKDSVLLRLVNPGAQNLYIKVTAAECGKFSKDSIVLRPKPEKPLWDSLDGMFPPCVPLGIADTIELQVQPQEGVKFRWSILEEEITEFDSNSIPVRVNYKLSDRNAPIPVSVYAYTEGCPNNSDTLSETLYAAGAGLEKKWELLQQEDFIGYIIGFSSNNEYVEEKFPLDNYTFYWYSPDIQIKNPTADTYWALDQTFPFDLYCNVLNTDNQCFSIYAIKVVDLLELQSVLLSTKKEEGTRTGKETESLQEQASFENEDIPCPGIALHPNPVRLGEQVVLDGICDAESFTVECYSQQGRCLFHTSAKGDTFTIPTGSYAAGVYIIRIQPDGAATPIIKKLIII